MAVFSRVVRDEKIFLDQGEKLLFDPFLVRGIVTVLVAQQNGGLFWLGQLPDNVSSKSLFHPFQVLITSVYCF